MPEEFAGFIAFFQPYLEALPEPYGVAIFSGVLAVVGALLLAVTFYGLYRLLKLVRLGLMLFLSEEARTVWLAYRGKGRRVAPPSNAPHFNLGYEMRREEFWRKVKADMAPDVAPSLRLAGGRLFVDFNDRLHTEAGPHAVQDITEVFDKEQVKAIRATRKQWEEKEERDS